MRLPRLLTPRTVVSAHCDLPCGVYDPAQAQDRGRVGQGHLREVPGQHRPRVPHPRPDHQGAAGRARQAPPVGAVDRLLQGRRTSRSTPTCTSCSTRPRSSPARPAPRARPTRPRPTSCWPRSRRSRRSSGRPSRRDRHPAGDPGSANQPSRSGRHVPGRAGRRRDGARAGRVRAGGRASATSPRSSSSAALFGPAPALFGHVAVDARRPAAGLRLWFLNFSTWAAPTASTWRTSTYARPPGPAGRPGPAGGAGRHLRRARVPPAGVVGAGHRRAGRSRAFYRRIGGTELREWVPWRVEGRRPWRNSPGVGATTRRPRRPPERP